MEIIKKSEGNKLVVEVQGRLDTVTAPDLEQELSSILDSTESLVLDFAKLDYISSAGLRVLLSTQKKLMDKGGMTITNVNEEVMEVFDITGFSTILTIEK